MKHKLLLGILCALALGAGVVYWLRTSDPTAELPLISTFQPLYLQNVNYLYQKEIYSLYKTQKADVVMFGDSHTYSINWSEALGRPAIANRGIRGDILQGFIKRIDNVIALQPKVCFLMGGINDFYAYVSVDKVFTQYCELIDTLRSHNISVVLQATLYVGAARADADERNKQVTELNTKLRAYATAHSLRFIDINPLISEQEALKTEMTVDGLHLNARGYQLWLPEVEKALVAEGL